MKRLTAKEIDQLNASIDKRIKNLLKEESEKHGMSMTEYLERLIEGTLPNRLEAKIEELRKEIQALRYALK